jgi:hypothetical protein
MSADAYLRSLASRKRRALPPQSEPEESKPTPGLVSQGTRSGSYPRPSPSPDALIREAIARTSGRVGGGWERLA